MLALLLLLILGVLLFGGLGMVVAKAFLIAFAVLLPLRVISGSTYLRRR